MATHIESIYADSPSTEELEARAAARRSQRDADEAKRQEGRSFRRDALAIGGILAAAVLIKVGVERYDASHYTPVTVHPKAGETLWHAVQRGQGFDEDPRPEVDRIERELGTTDLSGVEEITVHDD